MSIPLPALGINPPQQQPGPLDQVSKAIALKSLLQNQQIQQQDIQQKTQQVNDVKARTQAMRSVDPKSPTYYDDLARETLNNGGSADAAQAIQVHGQAIQKNASDIAKNDAETGDKKTDTIIKRHDMLLGEINAAEKVSDDQLVPHLTETIARLSRPDETGQALMPPQFAQQAQQILTSNLPPAQLRQHLDDLKLSLQGSKEQFTQAKEQQQTKTAAAQQQEAETNTAVKKLELQWGGNPQMQEAHYRYVLERLAAKQSVSPDDMAMATAYEASQRKSTTTSDSLGVTSTNTSGPTGLGQFRHSSAGGGGTAATGTAQPNAKQSIVDLIGNYQADPTLMSRMFLKHPDILGLIHDKYPDFDQTTYNAKNKAMIGYTSGSQSKEINAINTALGHAGVADDAVNALNNNNLVLLNKLGNQIGVNVTGQTAAAAFKTIIHRLGPEITAAYIAGGGGEGERGANAADFSENLPPQTLHNNLAISANLLRSKISSLENQYKQTVGRDDFTQRFITPGAQASLNKFGGQEGSGATTRKTLSMAAVQKAAQDHGVSVDEAKRQAIEAGYTIQ